MKLYHQIHKLLQLIQTQTPKLIDVFSGTRSDLREHFRITSQAITDFMQKYPNVKLEFQTSALTGENITQVFEQIVESTV